MDERLDQLEIKMAYLEQANSELSDELVRQRHDMEALRRQLLALTGRVEAAQSQPPLYNAEDEKPPHY